MMKIGLQIKSAFVAFTMAVGCFAGLEGDPTDDFADESESEVCGDGVVDPGEDCDPGASNTDYPTCTPACRWAVCGDGYVNKPESCDDGNTIGSDSCTNNCTFPHCGDGIISSNEECDDGNADNADACLDTCKIAACGDGHVHTGFEECDDGNFESTDSCTVTCTVAFCGDGHVRAGIEACDDGNGADTDECTADCKPATCGDGHIHQGVEECDDGNTDDLDWCSATCAVKWRYVFVTSETYDGDFGGIEGANAKCAQLANAASLPGVYLAWLSDSETSPSQMFTKSEVPYKRVDGAVIAADWAALLEADLQNSISVTELQEHVSGDLVWTNTLEFGSSAIDFHCFDWTSSIGDGLTGSVDEPTLGQWTVFEVTSCGNEHRLYCFQQ